MAFAELKKTSIVADSATTAAKVRYRGILSCDLCRQRNSCKIREISCTYTTNSLPKPAQKERKLVNDSLERVRRLEELVSSLASDAKSPSTDFDTKTDISVEAIASLGRAKGLAKHTNQPEDLAIVNTLGKIQVNGDQTIYVSAAHWATIRDEVRNIRESLGDAIPNLADEDASDRTFRGPLLLRGISKPLNVEEVLESMPPKHLVDVLVSRFFASSQPSIVLLHTVEFQHQYDRFWSDPYEINLSWLSILFSTMAITTHLYQQAGDTVPEALGPATMAMNTFHLRATECLLLANYLKPTTYTIEALLVNIQQEFLRSIDIDDSLWVMAATIIRLAMKAGYHRDSAAHSQISPFRGEMRRRAWALLVQLDILVSNQFGLPRMLVSDQVDTLPPHNLLDEDFDEHSNELPPSRPFTIYTPIAFTIAKGNILEVLAEIVNRSTSVRASTLQEVMQLDANLTKAYIGIPPPLKLTADPAIAIPHPVLIRRYLLELLYQKARLILHRGSMEKAQEDPKYGRSRSICVDAAMRLLELQSIIHQQVHKGGVLQRDKWFLWSLEQNDFVLAAMVTSLELSLTVKHGDDYKPPMDELGHVTYDRNTLLQALRVSHSVWTDSSAQSRTAAQASRLLFDVLEKADGSLCAATSTVHARNAAQAVGIELSRQNSSQLGVLNGREPTSTSGAGNGNASPSSRYHSSSEFAFGDQEALSNFLDWENILQNPEMDANMAWLDHKSFAEFQ